MRENRIVQLLLLLLLPVLAAQAENWDQVMSSGEYYYGVGHGQTKAEASEQAMAELVGMIATNVSSEFVGLSDETNTNGSIDHRSKVLNCVKTYSQGSLTNVDRMEREDKHGYVVLCYMKRTELARIYEGRIAKAKDMVLMAGECLEKRKVDMALQYYYWAYSLIRSVQRPNEVTDEQGRLLVDWLPLRIDEILGAITVLFEQREGDYVDLLFSYKGQPVSSLDFVYSDGRTDCPGTAKDGRGQLEMAPGYETDAYHLAVEYEYKSQARGDAEMESVLNVLGRKAFKKAEATIDARQASQLSQTERAEKKAAVELAAAQAGITLTPTATQTVASEDYADVVMKVIAAIKARKSLEAQSYFTFEGREVFRALIGYGSGRIVGTPRLQLFKSDGGRVVARGLQMSFTVGTTRKKTFVEDVVFTLNAEKKIENMAFGLGQVAEQDILCRNAPTFKDETREMIMEFLENYKTAYCLKRLDYIRDIFADDATIIIGNVVRRNRTAHHEQGEHAMTAEGRDIIKYNRYSKDQYLKNLKTCFDRNEFINLRFSNNDVQWLEKFDNKEIYGIRIGQEYSSTSYSDKGYLYLMVDMTDHDQPLIKVRTWQPNEVDVKKLYTAGDFFND